MCSWEPPLFVYCTSFYWINVARSNFQTRKLCGGKRVWMYQIKLVSKKDQHLFYFVDAFEIETRQILTLCLPTGLSSSTNIHKTNWGLLQEPPSTYARQLKSLNPISNKQMNQRGFMRPKNVKYDSVSNP